MNTIVNCPQCSGPLTIGDELRGQGVMCPRCSLHFIAPGNQLMMPVQATPAVRQFQDEQLPINILVNVPPSTEYRPTAPRLRSTGWFTRAFGTSMGLMIGFFVSVALCCGGGSYFLSLPAQREFGKAVEQIKEDEASAKKVALQTLSRYGFNQLSKDTTVGRRLEDKTSVHVVGHAKKKDGSIHDFAIAYRVTEWDGETRYKVESLRIDDDEIELAM